MEKNYSPKDLGARLRDLLIEKDILQREFAGMLSRCESYSSRVIKGERSLTLSSLDKTCKFLDTTPNYLIYGIGK